MAEKEHKPLEAVFEVKVVPGSSKTALAGVMDGRLKIKVAAPPEKGKANACLIRFLANLLNVSQRQVFILSGASKPIKKMKVQGVSESAMKKVFMD